MGLTTRCEAVHCHPSSAALCVCIRKCLWLAPTPQPLFIPLTSTASSWVVIMAVLPASPCLRGIDSSDHTSLRAHFEVPGVAFFGFPCRLHKKKCVQDNDAPPGSFAKEFPFIHPGRLSPVLDVVVESSTHTFCFTHGSLGVGYAVRPPFPEVGRLVWFDAFSEEKSSVYPVPRYWMER